MSKLLRTSLLSVMGALVIAGSANAACSDGITEKTWDKTASGYCKIFFPNCTKDSVGKKVSYSREYAGTEVICTGEKGQYDAYYKVSIKDANSVFKTDFAKMGVNYTSELSQWLFENCKNYCDGASDVKVAEPVSQYDLKKADDAAAAAEEQADTKGSDAVKDAASAVKEIAMDIDVIAVETWNGAVKASDEIAELIVD